MTASSRINSHTALIIIDETLDNITVEGGDFSVNERNIDRQTLTHHIVTRQDAPQKMHEFLSGHLSSQLESKLPYT